MCLLSGRSRNWTKIDLIAVIHSTLSPVYRDSKDLCVPGVCVCVYVCEKERERIIPALSSTTSLTPFNPESWSNRVKYKTNMTRILIHLEWSKPF